MDDIIPAFANAQTRGTPSSHAPNVIKMIGAIGGRNSRELQPPCPFLTWFQGDWFFDHGTIYAEHLFVLFVSKINHGFGFPLPWIPDNYKRKRWQKNLISPWTEKIYKFIPKILCNIKLLSSCSSITVLTFLYAQEKKIIWSCKYQAR